MFNSSVRSGVCMCLTVGMDTNLHIPSYCEVRCLYVSNGCHGYLHIPSYCEVRCLYVSNRCHGYLHIPSYCKVRGLYVTDSGYKQCKIHCLIYQGLTLIGCFLFQDLQVVFKPYGCMAHTHTHKMNTGHTTGGTIQE